MGNIAAAHWGHDASMTFYNSDTNTFHVIEMEKLTGIKHYRGHGRLDEVEDILKECLKISRDEFGIKNEYDFFILGSSVNPHAPDYHEGQILHRPLVEKIFNVRKGGFLINFRHHNGHAYGAYSQSPWFGDQATIFTFDAGGDDGHTFLWDAEGHDVRSVQKVGWDHTVHKWESFFGRNYNIAIGHGCVNIVNNTSSVLDLSGKAMGAAAYGSDNTKFHTLGQRLFKIDWSTIKSRNPAFDFWADEYRKDSFDMWEEGQGRGQYESGKEWLTDIFFDTPEDNNIYQIMPREKFPTWREECDIARGIQDEFENKVLTFLQKHEEVLYRNKNRLVISGGCGLNVLLNRRIQEEFGLDVFVPPDVTDVGLPLGFIVRWMSKRKWDQDRVTISYAGPKLRDLDCLDYYKDNYHHEEITVEDLSNRLKNDEIVGLVQGGIEVGPRALGNRSILCDPKGWDKKEKVNVIKRREWYRPFAPVCRKEDAEWYFSAVNYNNLSFMNFAVDVRPQHAEALAAITHVDGSARLQTVTRDQNELLYDILSEFDGVLLNTSFNVRGKPILNTLKEAFEVLNETELDAVVVYHNEKLWYFNTKKI